MEILMEIRRQENSLSIPYTQKISFNFDEGVTLAGALRRINEGEILDVAGEKISPISFEHSCFQKKCGACAMLVNGKPQLACDTFLKDYIKKRKISIAPLSKFPVIRDLIVDRSMIYENLKLLEAWSEDAIRLNDKNTETAYEASRCLACGCCLEVCPNFYFGGDFYGAAGFTPVTRIAVSLRERMKNLEKSYKEHIYDGCGKSLACMDICPAEINIDKLLSKSNSRLVWKRKK